MKYLLVIALSVFFISAGNSKVLSVKCLKSFDQSSSPLVMVHKIGAGKVYENCLQTLNIDVDVINDFFTAERVLGSTLTEAHIESVKLFGISHGDKFSKKRVRMKELESLIYFSADILEYYSRDQIFDTYYDQLDVYKDAKELKDIEFHTWLKKILVKTEVLSDAVTRRDELETKALEEIVRILFYMGDTVTIYPIVEENDSNSDMDQWVVVGRKHILLLGKFFYL